MLSSFKSVRLLDPAAVTANQIGQLTDEQKNWLNLAARGFGALQAVLPIIILGVFACFFLPMFGSFGSFSILPILFFLLILGAIVAQVSGGLVKTIRLATRLREDLSQVSIRQIQGQLGFQKGSYVVPLGEQILSLPPGSETGGMLPGVTYRLFYLEKSGLVISAEELYPPSMAQVRVALTGILAEVNKFSPEDIELNRTGEISPTQRMKALPQAIFGAVFGLIALVFVGLTLMPSFSGQDFSIQAAAFIPMIISGIFLLIGGFMFVRAVLDMVQSSPAQVEGDGRKEKRVSGGKNRSTRYYYVIGGTSFQVNRQAYTALIDGLDYRVFYLPNTKRLLSIEPITLS
ncbi:MAG: hypothetical protein EHM81_09590 [Chloroflexi bacterium]|nr:MAG: hypothetical protein EHM81_09590 [Chloroflexota bacterium]